MSNKIKSYNLTFTPQQGGWAPAPLTLQGTPEGGTDELNLNFDDVENPGYGKLWPETKYDITGEILDMHDTNVFPSDVEALQTKNDYPSVGLGDVIKVSVDVDPLKISDYSTDSGSREGIDMSDEGIVFKVSPEVTGSALESSTDNSFTVNGNANVYSEYEENDWEIGSNPTEWSRKLPDSRSELQNTQLLFNRYAAKKIFFGAENRKLGLQEISSTLNDQTLSHAYTSQSAITVQGTTRFEASVHTPNQFPFVKDNEGIYEETGKLVLNLLPFKDSVDEQGQIDVTLKSKSKKTDPSTSVFTIPFVAYKKPTVQFSGAPTVDYSSITYNSDSITVSTNANRPFIPLKHFKYDRSECVIGSKISSIPPYSQNDGFTSLAGYHDGGSEITNPGYKFVVSISSNDTGDPVKLDDPLNPWNHEHWKPIGIENEYDMVRPDMKDDKSIDGLEQFNRIEENNGFDIATWPARNSGITGLIPGETYGIRVICANNPGTAIEYTTVKTNDPETPVFDSTAVYNTSTAQRGGSLSVQTGGLITVTGGVTITGGTEVYNSANLINIISNPTVEPTYSRHETEAADATLRFSTSGIYTVTITAPNRSKVNTAGGVNVQYKTTGGYSHSYTYTITVTDGDSLSVTTEDPTSVTTTSASISGSYSATGSTADNMSSTYFKYRVKNTGEWMTVGETTSVESSFSYNLTGLTPNTTYEYQAFAVGKINGTDTTKEGVIREFTTESEITPNINVNASRTNASITITLQ